MRYLLYIIFLFFTTHFILAFLCLKSYANRLEDIGEFNRLDTLIHPSRLQEAKFDVPVWQNLEKEIFDGNFGLMHSVLIVNDNKLIVEKYYNKWQKDTIHDIQSATKSVASALIGIAIDKGFIKSVNKKMVSMFADFTFDRSDSLKKTIRLKDMLTMSAGIQWNEQTIMYNEPGNSLTDMYALEKNWIEYILKLPVTDTPGTKFNYSSGISILLGKIIEQSTKMSVQKFAEKYLFGPLGIQKYHWSEYFGVAHCGGGLYLTPLDMAKIGNLYYNEGSLEGKQIISKNWIKESLLPRFRTDYKTSYGYQWWIMDSLFDFRPVPFASGNGWQFIFIIKEFKMVVVTTGHNYAQEAPKTTMSYTELIYSILSSNPQFQKRIKNIYEQQLNLEPANFYDVFVLAYCLNRQGEYAKTITYLEKVENRYSGDLRLNFLMGEAYYYTGDIAKAKPHLERCIAICDEHNYPKPGYCQMATSILEKLAD